MKRAILDLLQQTPVQMDSALIALASMVPTPQSVPFKNSIVFRHVERLPSQAIVQKLARLPSGLRAVQLLLDNGYFQEQSALERVIDEIGEDVLFLSVPLIFGDAERIHEDFLQAFFAEEYDATTGLPVGKGRPMVKRKKIRAYITRSPVGTDNPGGQVDAGAVLSKAYSGFVHAASPHIMDMYGGNPPRFYTAGMLGTPREAEHREDVVNYYYRSVTAFVVAAKALRHQLAYERMFTLFTQYEAAMGLSP